MERPHRLMFICLGNICRSPLAHALAEHLAAGMGMAVEVESSGTAARYHEGARADARMRRVASRHGLQLNSRSLQFQASMAEYYDLLLVMDYDNYYQVKHIINNPTRLQKVQLLRAFDPQGSGEVSDPYYGGRSGFENVYTMIERSCRALLQQLQQQGRR